MYRHSLNRYLPADSKRPRGLALVGLLVISAASAVGCAEERTARADQPATRGEAARLCHAIDQLRNADNSHKELLLERLENTPCENLCKLKEVCQAAYREHVSALSAIHEARAIADVAPRPAPSVEALAVEKLDEAQRRLASSRDKAQLCVSQQGEVKRRYRL